MYAVIYWTDDSTVYPLTNEDGTLTLFDNIQEADNGAEKIELDMNLEPCESVRVISIDGVDDYGYDDTEDDSVKPEPFGGTFMNYPDSR